MTRGSAASVFGRTAGLAAIILLETYWFWQAGPLAFKGLVALIVGVSLARPAVGLLIFAALAPLSATTPAAENVGRRQGDGPVALCASFHYPLSPIP